MRRGATTLHKRPKLPKRGPKRPKRGRLYPLGNTLLEQHEPLVIKAVNRRIARMGVGRIRRVGPGHVVGSDLGKELHQEGMTALWRASTRFDPKKGRFSTIATPHVERAIGRALKNQGPIRLGERETRRRLNPQKYGRSKTGETGLPKLAPVSDAPQHSTAGGIDRMESHLRFTSLTKHLPKRTLGILKASASMSRAEIAKRYRISKTRVHQILERTKHDLRKREAA